MKTGDRMLAKSKSLKEIKSILYMSDTSQANEYVKAVKDDIVIILHLRVLTLRTKLLFSENYFGWVCGIRNISYETFRHRILDEIAQVCS
jgi:fumarate reductase subunit C